jgi:hypothetical protein
MSRRSTAVFCHHILSLLYVFVGVSSLSLKLASPMYFFLQFWS